MKKIEIKDFIDGPILREADFRANIQSHDWTQYSGERVLIQGCSDIIIPIWAYLVVTARLTPHAKKIDFGEQKSWVPIYNAAETDR